MRFIYRSWYFMEHIRTEFIREALDRIQELHEVAKTPEEKILIAHLLFSLHQRIEPADLELKNKWNKILFG